MPYTIVPGPATISTGTALPLAANPQKRPLTINASEIPLIKDTVGSVSTSKSSVWISTTTSGL